MHRLQSKRHPSSILLREGDESAPPGMQDCFCPMEEFATTARIVGHPGVFSFRLLTNYLKKLDFY